MKKTSIGTWAYNVGPYGENPIPFDTVGETLSKLKFDGLLKSARGSLHSIGSKFQNMSKPPTKV